MNKKRLKTILHIFTLSLIIFILGACTSEDKKTIISEALTSVSVDVSDKNQIESDFSLVVNKNPKGVIITVSSDNEAVVSFDDEATLRATVTQLKIDTTVTLTVSGKYKEETLTSTIQVTIKKKVDQTYQVIFNSMGGSFYEPITLLIGSTIPLPNNPTKEGFSFEGWFMDKNLTIAYSETLVVNENTTLYAKWTPLTYTITYQTGLATDIVHTYTFSEAIIKPNDPYLDGYSFTGWDQEIPAIMPAQDLVFKAQFSLNEYVITYHLEGGINPDENKTTYSILEEIVFKVPTKEGHTFKGWYKDEYFLHEISSTKDLTKNLDLYARFEANVYEVVFYADDAITVLETLRVTHGKTPTPTVPIKEKSLEYSYVFTGWDKPLGAITQDTSYKAIFKANPNAYTFTWITDEGAENTIYHYGETIPPMSNPTKIGYTFTGWDQEVPTTMPAQNVIITATFSINTYSVIYMVDGEVYGEVMTVTYNDPVVQFEAPSKTGYTFSGWSSIPLMMPANDVVITGSFTVNAYNLVLVVDDIEKVIVYNYGQNIIDVSDPVKEGYTFTNWDNLIPDTMPAYDLTFTALFEINTYEILFYDEDFVTVIETLMVDYNHLPTPTIEPTKAATQAYSYHFKEWNRTVEVATSDATYYAVYTQTPIDYEVLYELDGGLNHPLNPSSHNIDSKTLLNEASKTGYTFKGWYLDGAFTEPINEISGFSQTITLYALFEINQYQLTLSEGLSASTELSLIEYGTFVTITINYDDTTHEFVSLKMNNEVILLEANLPGQTYSFTIKEDVTFVLQTVELGKHTVEFVLENNTTYDTEIVYYGSLVTKPTDPVKDGHTFQGWLLDGGLYDFNTPITANISLLALFEINTYEISFYDEDMTTLIDTFILDYGVLPNPTLPTKESTVQYTYTFSGWTPLLEEVKENKTYVATYTETQREYTVTFYDEDEITILESLMVQYGKIPNPNVTPLKEETAEYSYTFNGWNPALEVVTENKTYVAVYDATIKSYTLTVVNGAENQVYTYEVGSSITPLADPIKEGYTFTGWNKVVPITMPAENLVITAQFTINTYTVTYLLDGSYYYAMDFQYNSPVYMMPDVTQTGYTFSGWSPILSVMPASNITINGSTTLIDYELTYVLDGGVNHSNNPAVYQITSQVTLNPASKGGMLFAGWFTSSDYTERVTTIYEGSTGPVTLYAKFINGVGNLTTTLDWVNGKETQVKQAFEQAYIDAGFTVSPSNPVIEVKFNQARVMLYQVIDNEGIIFLNEVNGKAFYTTNINVKTETGFLFGNDLTLLGIVRQDGFEYFITDDAVYQIEATTRTRLINTVGRGETETSYVGYWDITLNDFNKAYKFSENYMTSLGLPLSFVYSKVYNTYDLNSNGTYVTGKPKSDKTYLVQPFENGWIIQARGRLEEQFAQYAVQHGAAPILNDMYDLVTGVAGNANLNITGAPVSIEFTYNGIRYQNFEYGYGKLVNGAFSFTHDLVVDIQGTEMSRIIGAGEHFDNWRTEINFTGGYELPWERLRVGQDFRNVVGKMIRNNSKPYNSEGGIHHTIHELDGMGVVQIFKDGTGATVGFGNSFVVQGPWWAGAHEIAPELNAFALSNRDILGRPIRDWEKIGSTIRQVFEHGTVEKVGSAEPVIK